MPGDTLILCYHAVSPNWPSELAVKPEALRAQLESLLAEGYKPVTFTEAALAGASEERLFAATFDDAFLSVFEYGRAVLAELGVPGTLYVPTDFPESGVPFPLPEAAWIGGEHEAELAVMDWDQVRQLRDEGWEIGSHTCSHPWLTQTSDEQLREELTRSKSICSEQLGEETRSIAYPYGNHDDRVVAATAAAGYEAACTVPHRFEAFESSPLRYARIDVTRTESARSFRLRTAAWSRRARTTPPARAGYWLDTHRPRRSTVLAAARRGRRRVETIGALRERRGGWGGALRAARDSDGFERFAVAYVDRPYTRHFDVPVGGLVVDAGAGDELFGAFAEEAGAGRVLRPRVGSPPNLDALLAELAGERLDFLKLTVRGAAGAVAVADAETLARIDRLVLFYDPAVDPRVDEVVGRLQGLGFETWLDLDPDSGAGLISARAG
jgi:peptidoglycan/xylan/chitin deacetylase (PgdA/CDA1 family)